MYSSFTVMDENKEEVKCDIVAMFTDGKSDYVAYTDGTMIDGELELFTSKYETKDNTVILKPIYKDEEWDFIDKYLSEKVFNDED